MYLYRILTTLIVALSFGIALTAQPAQSFFSGTAKIVGVKQVDGQIKVVVRLKSGLDSTIISSVDLMGLMRFYKVERMPDLIGKSFPIAMVVERQTASEVKLTGKNAWKANLHDMIARGQLP